MVLDDGLGIENEYFVEQRHLHMVQKNLEIPRTVFLVGGERRVGDEIKFLKRITTED